MVGPGLDASPTRMPLKLICQRTKITAKVAPNLERRKEPGPGTTGSQGHERSAATTRAAPETRDTGKGAETQNSQKGKGKVWRRVSETFEDRSRATVVVRI